LVPDPDNLDGDDADGAIAVLDPEFVGDLGRVMELKDDMDGGEIGRREAGRVDLAQMA
jgi:hypothetical protein